MLWQQAMSKLVVPMPRSKGLIPVSSLEIVNVNVVFPAKFFQQFLSTLGARVFTSLLITRTLPIVWLSEGNLLLALHKVDTWLVKDKSGLFWCEPTIELLTTLTSLSCFVSTWWDRLSHDYGKKKSLSSVSLKRWVTVQHQLQCAGVSCDQQRMRWVLDTAVPPPSLVRNRAWKEGRVEPLGKPLAASDCFLLLTQVDARLEAPGCYLLSRCLLFTYSNVNICSCMQRKDSML